MVFRISISLNSFFNDQRSLSYILIDNRFKTIEDLEEHIKLIFGINNDSEICLLSNNHLLPSSEGIDILCPNESIIVVPVKHEFYIKKIKNTQIPSNSHSNKRPHSVSDADNVENEPIRVVPVKREVYVQKLENPQISSNNQSNKRTHSVSDTENVDFEPTDDLIETFNINIFKKSKKINTVYRPSDRNGSEPNENIVLRYNDMNNKINNKAFEEPSSSSQSQTVQSNNIPNESYKCFDEQGHDIKAIKIINIENVGHMEISQTTQNLENPSLDNSTNVESKCNIKPVLEKNINCFQRMSQNEISSNKEKKIVNIPFTVGNILSSTNNKLVSEANVSQDNDFISSNIPTKKRKRIRTRKPRKKCIIPIETSTPTTENTNNDEFKVPLETKPLKPIHIRFDDDPIKMFNDDEETNSEIHKDTYKNSVSKNESTISNGLDSFPTETSKDYNCDVKNIFKNLDLSKPELDVKTTMLNENALIKKDDILAFKLYEFNANYEPSISNWVIGKVITYNNSKDIQFEILAGVVQTNVPFGKFNIPKEDENKQNDQDNTVDLNFVSLIDPRLVVK